MSIGGRKGDVIRSALYCLAGDYNGGCTFVLMAERDSERNIYKPLSVESDGRLAGGLTSRLDHGQGQKGNTACTG